MGFGSILGSVAQGALGLIGMNKQQDAYNSNMAFSREQFDYQKQLHQNQIQWRVSDAQKAGLHPMAALGLSSSSFSPVSTPSIPDYGSGYSNLGDAAASLGQNIDSAIMAGKTKEEREAAQSLQQKAADISLQKGEAELEGIKLENDQKRWFLQQQMFPRTPAVTQNPVIGGQGDLPVAPPKEGYIGEPEIQFNPTAHDPNVFIMNAGNDVTSLWEDKDIAGVIPLDMWPIIRANFIDYASRLRGKVVNGMVYDNARGGWVSINGPYGKAALADNLGIGNFFSKLGKVVSGVLPNREKFDPEEYARRFYTF